MVDLKKHSKLVLITHGLTHSLFYHQIKLCRFIRMKVTLNPKSRLVAGRKSHVSSLEKGWFGVVRVLVTMLDSFSMGEEDSWISFWKVENLEPFPLFGPHLSFWWVFFLPSWWGLLVLDSLWLDLFCLALLGLHLAVFLASIEIPNELFSVLARYGWSNPSVMIIIVVASKLGLRFKGSSPCGAIT